MNRSRPNIVVILADDMGFSDIGCYGSEIPTPNLDRLAKQGLRFTQFYNCARCCPSRASLLTGLYPHQTGVGHMVQDRGFPGYRGFLNRNCATIGQVLRPAGYQTLYVGKWHASPGIRLIGETAAPGTPGKPYPLTRGFDRFYGTMAGGGSYYNPNGLMDQDRRISAGDDFYYTDVIGQRAQSMIQEAIAIDSPFFLHVCYTAPHWPLHARQEDIEQFRGRYRKGWDHFRKTRHEELKGLGIVQRKWDISPRDEQSQDFFDYESNRREWEDLRMAVYAAQVMSMDRSIGGIIEALEQQGIADNTLIMFLSDNGGCAEFLDEDGEGRTHASQFRYTSRQGEICRAGNIVGLEPGPSTTFMSYDLPWANVSNSPFRLYKHWVHEGGISTPMIACWPGGNIPKGELHHAPAHLIDIMATCLDLTGAVYPKELAGYEIIPHQGESLVPAFRNSSWRRDRPLFWEHEGNRAVRIGDWKAVSRHPGDWELYNMAHDRTELNDLSHADPDRLKQMTKSYMEWADRCGVLPWPLPKMSPQVG